MAEQALVERCQALSDEQLVRAYREGRDRKEAEQAALKEQQKPLLLLMDALETEGKRRMLEREADSFATAAGTCYQSLKVNVSVKDRAAFFDWLVQTEQWDVADIRAAKKSIQDYAASNGGDLPPGVSMSSYIAANFRAPANK